jgi:formyl-CoA transferase
MAVTKGALSGLRALEMGQLIAGPFCGQLMADHGAEVIKIELPGDGDPMRTWGRGKPVWFPVIARNKKCITLDVRQPEGKEILRQLLAKADFLVENFRPGTLEKWGLGFDALHALNDRLILVRVSGFGQTGPYASRAGYGSIGEAMGGMRYLAGDPSTPPSRVGLSIGDSLAATYACLGALMALHHRHVTGKGQVVDCAIYEAVLAMLESTVPEYTEAGIIRERTGSILPKIAPSNVYQTLDGQILIGANQDSVWKRLAEAMGRPALATDARYAGHVARGENQVELDATIEAWTRGFTSQQVLDLLHAAGVPAGKIYRAPDMLDDEQYKARESLVKVPHAAFPNLWMANVFPKLSATPGGVNWAGPAVGEHNEEVYGALLGYGKARLAELRESRVI